MKKLCDLHTHSKYSDGTDSPEKLVELAEKAGLSAIALTDHNTTGGLRPFMEAGAKSSVMTVPGCEFSTEFNGREAHIVGLFLPERSWDAANEYTRALIIRKKKSNEDLIAKLQSGGYDITYDEVAETVIGGKFNRANVAAVLLKKGYINDTKEAFGTILSSRGGYYTPPRRLDPFETIRFIKECGGVSVLAHGLTKMSERRLRIFLPLAKEAGLDAMEIRYSEFTPEDTAVSEALAKEFGLLPGGGSDYHGSIKPHIQLGIGKGGLEVPFEWCEKLAELAAR